MAFLARLRGDRAESTEPIRLEDARRAVANVQLQNAELEFMIDDSLAAQEHGSLQLFSHMLRSRAAEVQQKLKAVRYVGAGRIEEPPSIAPPPATYVGTSADRAPPPPGTVLAPAAAADLRSGAAAMARPSVNVGFLCGRLRREREASRARLQMAGESYSPGDSGSPPRILAPISQPPPVPPPAEPLPNRICSRKLRPISGKVLLKEQPPAAVVRGKVNYDALLREQAELNARRLEGERMYGQLMERFEAYHARLLQALPQMKLFTEAPASPASDVPPAPVPDAYLTKAPRGPSQGSQP
eukprot:TRINITY_DN14122_c0_g1_i1.p1 TRINITY_DN14122_c0_g1~~TRINITY_DN14122_c0_g1_i1.p1  ORF type:complete len:325 (+),score=112.11 TRINITY_DN14122_c0_g1_i1:79-975(+)